MKKKAILIGFACLLLVGGCAQNRYRMPSAERYYEEAKIALSKKKCWNAQQLYRNLLGDFPGSHLVDEAQFGLGNAAVCSEDYVTAVFEYERLLNEFPTSPYVDEARYQIGMCYYYQSRDVHHDQSETQQAIREFRRFIEDYPNSELVPQTEKRILELRKKMAAKKLMIARNYLQWKNPVSAEKYCAIIQSEFMDIDVTREARFLMAVARHRQGKLEEALEMLMVLTGEGLPQELKEEVSDQIKKVQESIAKRSSASTAAVKVEPGPAAETPESK
ncbi:MAG: outer membrane protein assembly factor BamD [bacterium]|nr:outer membrane protein assembly factor BamD [bacterium]